MNKFLENTNLNINSWLVNCGLMFGHLRNCKIHCTKFTFIKWLIAFSISIFTTIKWTILLLYPKDSLISHLLGDWGYFYGPKLLIDLIILFCAIFVLSVFVLFYYSSKHPKTMLFWLEKMEFDPVNRCFNNLNLNESDSMIFTKRMYLLRIIYNNFVYSFLAFYVISVNYSAFTHKRAYYIYYFISILFFCPQFYINSYCIYGSLIILYQVTKFLLILSNLLLIIDLFLFTIKIS